jgi:cell wall-associated NlpC family hydrolase
VRVYEESGGFAFAEAAKDGYVGYIESASLGAPIEATHIVAVPATHLYPAPNLKRIETMALSFGSCLRIVSASGEFFETDDGLFIPKPHVRPAKKPFADPATVAQLFFGAPYLWGGNSIWGIDCSGLVQAAMLASGHPCPGDADLQEEAAGEPLPEGEAMRRGDLLFWSGHVAMAVDGETIVHANAHTMSVAYENLNETIARVEGSGGGPVTSRRRPRVLG